MNLSLRELVLVLYARLARTRIGRSGFKMVSWVETAFLNTASHSYDDVVKFLQFLLAEFLERGNRRFERQPPKGQIINFLFLQSEPTSF